MHENAQKIKSKLLVVMLAEEPGSQQAINNVLEEYSFSDEKRIKRPGNGAFKK